MSVPSFPPISYECGCSAAGPWSLHYLRHKELGIIPLLLFVFVGL